MSQVIKQFNDNDHRAAVIDLWSSVFGYQTAHNEPELVIDKKLAVDDGLFFVAEADDVVVGTVLGGYDGHRGWVYSLAVLPDHQAQGVGSALMNHVETALAERGCLKINLQIMEGNEQVQSFYESLGYSSEKRVSMGKRVTDVS